MLRNCTRWLRPAALALALSLSPVYAAAAQETSSSSSALERPLKPGDYIWAPEASTSGPVEVVVSLPLQLAYVYRGGTLIGVSTVSTGKPGHETPAGSFEILQKRQEHYSNKYDNAPMPFMQRLTWDGIALHAGAIPGTPASHGCVRLPMKFAKALFGATKLGASVHIIEAVATPDEAVAFLRQPPAIQLAGGE
jgi:lipoprotein-anchoring transpeptidase ErfK/SrfK